jgi:hypothetical protein
MEETSVMMVGLNQKNYAGFGTLAISKKGQERNFRPVADYSVNVSKKWYASF